jgi:hypothetical protein
MDLNKPNRPWMVQIAGEVIAKAQREIEIRYKDKIARKDMEGWLKRFLEDVYERPLDVLGFPPKRAASNPDLIYFPADPRHKVSGLAHASFKKRVIYVYKISIMLPGEKKTGRKGDGHES